MDHQLLRMKADLNHIMFVNTQSCGSYRSTIFDMLEKSSYIKSRLETFKFY